MRDRRRAGMVSLLLRVCPCNGRPAICLREAARRVGRMEPVWQDERVRRGITTQLKAREEQLAAGARPLGWKVGFGTPAQQEKRGVTGAVVGFLLETPFSA